jgi:hypothetical protein
MTFMANPFASGIKASRWLWFRRITGGPAVIWALQKSARRQQEPVLALRVIALSPVARVPSVAAPCFLLDLASGPSFYAIGSALQIPAIEARGGPI